MSNLDLLLGKVQNIRLQKEEDDDKPIHIVATHFDDRGEMVKIKYSGRSVNETVSWTLGELQK